MDQIRKIDKNLVDAQIARRIIDRLVGYKVSPILWATLKKNMNFVSGSLSAGRVQSAAVKLLIDRERLRARFKHTTYFDILAELEDKKEKISFDALLIRYNEKTIASSRNFDSETGILKSNDVLLLDETQVSEVFNDLNDDQWEVLTVEEKPEHPTLDHHSRLAHSSKKQLENFECLLDKRCEMPNPYTKMVLSLICEQILLIYQ